MMVLVVGATGFLGTEICRELVNRDYSVKGMIRSSSDPKRVRGLKDIGVATVEGDLKVAPSVKAALEDVDEVVSTATATRSRSDGDGIESVDADGQRALIQAAADAGVTQFVLISVTGNIRSDDPLTSGKRRAEQALIDSGMTYTILRPCFFMEAWLSSSLGFDYANGRVQIFGSGDQKISWISLSDVARFATEVLKNPSAENAVIELGGPDALSPNEVVEIFERKSGRTFEIVRVPEEALQVQSDMAEDSMSRTFAALSLGYAKGDVIPMESTLETYPMDLVSVDDYAASVLRV
jgi:uncharacterized protein YbjT (DUF2867 family)